MSSGPQSRPSSPPTGFRGAPGRAPDYKVYRSRRGIFGRLRGRGGLGSGDVRARRRAARRGMAARVGGRRLGSGGGVPGAPELPDEPGRRNYGPGTSRRAPSAAAQDPLEAARRTRQEAGSAQAPGPADRLLAGDRDRRLDLRQPALLRDLAQIQSFKLAGEAKDALHGNPFILPSAQNILVIGTDARPVNTKEPGGAPRPKCYEQQEKGEAPHAPCSDGEFRADTLMVVRAGGGTFNKLSIPRDSFAEIPGEQPQKINAAFAFGGAALQIKTVEKFLNIQIDHVAIIDFTGLENLVDSVGGIEVDLPHKLCAEISGGSGHGQGGVTLHLKKGSNTLDGEQALAYSRIREPSECPGKGKSASPTATATSTAPRPSRR